MFGLVFAYASRTLFDASTFSKRVAQSLAEPAVAGVVADQVTDQVLAQYRDLTPYRPMVRGAIEYVVSSKPFRAVVKRAAKRGHSALISQAGENLSLTVADLGVVLRNALSMYPELAAKIPARAQVVLGTMNDWPAGKLLVRVLNAGKRLRLRALVWLSSGVVLGACGFMLARRKDRYLLRVGLGITATALVLSAAARFGGEVVSTMTRSPLASDLVRGLWPAFVGPLTVRMLVVAAVGLTIVAGVTSLLQKVNLAALARLVWDRLDDSPQRDRLGILRAALFIVVGGVVAFNPVSALECFGVIAGAVLFFVGVQEVFSIVMRAFERIQLAHAPTSSGGSFATNAIVIASIVAVIAGVGLYWVSRDEASSAVASVPEDACNGHPELCDRRLNEVCFATTHNSMAAADIADWMFPNQEKGIRTQLEDGVRGFLIDVHYGVPYGDRIKTMLEDEPGSMKKYTEVLGPESVAAAMRIRDRLVGDPSGDRDVYLGHGFCELGAEKFVDALEEMREFLVENPSEIVLMIVQDEGVDPDDVARCFASSGLEDFVYRGASTSPWPTLREMIDLDQRVVVFAENRVDSVPWYHLAFETIQETPYGFKTPEEFSNRANRGGTSGSLLLMNHWIETTPAPLPSNAEIVNAYDFLLARARACRRERRMMPNLIAVDFYRTGDLFRVVDTMNGIKPTIVVSP